MDNPQIDPNNLPSGAYQDVPVTLVISVGHSRTSVGTLLSLERNSVLPLDSRVEDPVTIRAGQRVVAYGELQEMEGDPPGRLAVRITRLAAPPKDE